MARMHSHSHGKSKTVKPYNSQYPEYIQKSPEEIINFIVNLAKKGVKPTQIGNILRDEECVGRISDITHKNLLQILKEHGVAPAIPEDLDNLVKKCSNIRNHLKEFKNDKDAKYRLNLAESKLYRLARYYKKRRDIPANWKPSFLITANK
ncbi:40S ribosomal protein S13 [Dictyocoela roeselum]|nr:40S ribosomal protein S13 [Dictyocoela roeselum]